MYVLSPAVLFGLQLLGLLPVSVNHLPLRGHLARPSRSRKLYSVLLLGCYIVALCHWLRKSADERQKMSLTTFKIASMCSGCSTFIGALVAQFVGVTRSNQKILLVEKLREVDFILQHKMEYARTRPVSLFILCGTIILSIAENVYNSLYEWKRFSYFIFMRTLFFRLVALLGILEIMEISLAIRERFQLVNQRVLETLTRRRPKQLMWTIALPYVETVTAPQEGKVDIPRLSEVHWRLCCIIHNINATYGIYFVAAMTFIFAHLVYYSFSVFVFIHDGHSWNSILFMFIWICHFIISLYMMVLPCSWTVKEAQRTVKIVTKSMGDKIVKHDFKELELFAGQLFHRDVEFNACGLFTLETSLVISVASAVTTYMAIIIQFQTST